MTVNEVKTFFKVDFNSLCGEENSNMSKHELLKAVKLIGAVGENL
jgi:hypothetical protein